MQIFTYLEPARFVCPIKSPWTLVIRPQTTVLLWSTMTLILPTLLLSLLSDSSGS